MIAVLDWVDGFGSDTVVSGIFENIEQAIAFVGDLKENAKKDYPSRYEEFSFGEVSFDYYEAKKFSNPKKMITEQNKGDNKMEIKNAWELNANTAKEVYGCHVDYEERFYICPYCGEPVFEEDWMEEYLEEFMCPICEDEDAEE